MYRKVFLTGGTGFVGSSIMEELIRNKYKVRALTHKRKLGAKVETVKGNVTDPDSFKDSVKECDVIIHLVGIIRESHREGVTFEKMHVEATKNMVEIAKENKIKRFIHMSANGTKPNGTKYETTKYRAEQIVKNSGLTFTIFRPSIIFGEHDNFINRLSGQVRLGIVPYIGDGNYKLQPISVETVAQAFVKSIKNEKAFNKTYHLSGPEVYSYKDLLDTIASVKSIGIIKVPIPAWFVRIFAAVLGWMPSFPITNDQITMLLGGNVCDSGEAKKDLNLPDVFLKESIEDYLFQNTT